MDMDIEDMDIDIDMDHVGYWYITSCGPMAPFRFIFWVSGGGREKKIK